MSEDDEVENEQLHQGDNDSNDQSTDEPISAFRTFKPSTAGISFDVSTKNQKFPNLIIKFSCGLYTKEEINKDDVENINHDLEDKKNKIIKLEDKSKKQSLELFENDNNNQNPKNKNANTKIIWKRKQIEFEFPIELKEINFTKTLTDHGLENCNIFIRKLDLKDYSTITIQIINTFVMDTSVEEHFQIKEENTLFQVSLEVSCFKASFFKPRQSKIYSDDEDTKSSELIYRNVKEYATGHNCSANWVYNEE